MTPEELLAALALPASSRVDQRVPKKTLLEHAALGSADKRLVTDGIERIQWLAALKPVTTAVPAYSDGVREYGEVAVLQLSLRGDALRNPTCGVRVIEQLHRAIPYPLLLLTDGAAGTSLSLAHKRRSLNEAGAVVVDGDLSISALDAIAIGIQPAFAAALSIARQPQTHLLALYQGWIDTLAALEAARITGRFTILATDQRNDRRREALRRLRGIDEQIRALDAAARKTSQVARQVEINLELQQLRLRRESTAQDL